MKYFVGDLKYYLNYFIFNKNTSHEIKELRENGIVIINNFLSDKECENHIIEIDKLIKNNSISWEDSEKSDVRIMGYDNLNKKAKQMFSKIDHLFNDYIDFRKNNNNFLMANKVTFKENNLGSGGGWHRDSINRRQLKFLIYLSDVNIVNGPFEYIPKTHHSINKFKTNKFLTKKVRYSNDEIRVFKDSLPSKIFNAKKGTCIIFDSSGLHRGTPIKKGFRYAITKYMYDSKIPLHISKLIIDEV